MMVLAAGLPAPGPAAGAVPAAIVVAPAGNGAYTVQGSGITNTAAFEFTLIYDGRSLANPRMTAGPLLTGALVAVNPNMPGMIRFAAVTGRPITGSGVLANIEFDVSGQTGGITAFTAKLASITGLPLPVVVQVVPRAVTPDQTTARPPAETIPDATRSTAVNLPVVMPFPVGPRTHQTMTTNPTVSAVRKENTPNPLTGKPPAPPAARTIAPAAAPLTAAGPDGKSRKSYSQQSVLDRFRDYTGERTPQAMTSLFSQDSLIGFHQEPAVALADGRTKVTMAFIAPDDQRGSPDIAVMGARLLSLSRDPASSNTWLAELLPEKNTMKAIMTIPLRDIMMVVPLTVAPAIELARGGQGAVTEADFKEFLRERGTAREPKNDLNRDGKRDYLDEFIYTANYLVKTGTAR